MKCMACGLEMSGVEVSKESKELQFHICASCMNRVIQTYNHFQEQIIQLRNEKAHLQRELKKLNEEHEKQKKIMSETINALEEKLAEIKKKSETHI
jgi:predicted nuclease with TOPRIM domain